MKIKPPKSPTIEKEALQSLFIENKASKSSLKYRSFSLELKAQRSSTEKCPSKFIPLFKLNSFKGDPHQFIFKPFKNIIIEKSLKVLPLTIATLLFKD